MTLTAPQPVPLKSPNATYQRGQAVPLSQKLINYFSPQAREAYFGRAVSDEELLSASAREKGGLLNYTPTGSNAYKVGAITGGGGFPQSLLAGTAYTPPTDNPAQVAPVPQATNNLFSSAYGSAGSPGGSDVVGAEYIADPRVTKYGTFDFNNPDDQARFFMAKLADLQDQRDSYVSDLERQVGRQLSEAELNLNDTLASIDQDIADTQGAATAYVQDYARTEQEFGEGKRLGDVRRQGFFAKASPNAYQSAQGTSQAFAQNKYIQGLADLAQGAEQAVGSEFLHDPTDYSRLGENSVYGRQLQGFNQDINSAGSKFNLFKESMGDYKERGIRDANEYVDTNRVSTADQFALPRQAAGLNPFTFARVQGREAAPSQVDLGQYRSFTDFKPVSASSTPGAGFAPRQSVNLFQNQNVQDAYLGRTPNLKQNDQEQLRKYLLGTGY